MSQLSRFCCLNQETSLSRRSLISHYLRLTTLDINQLWKSVDRDLLRSVTLLNPTKNYLLLYIFAWSMWYLTIIPRAGVGYEMIAKEARRAELAMFISYPTSVSGIIVLLKTRLKRNFKFKLTRTPTIFVDYGIFKDYSLKSRWIAAEYLSSREVNIQPLFTEIEKKNCFSIYSLSDLNNPFCDLTPWGVNNAQLLWDSEPIRLLETPRSLSDYILMAHIP